MFFKGSRYEQVPDLETVDDQGRTVTYKGIRWIPLTRARSSHRVAEHERLDHIAHYRLHDPELFWRICDANEALWPPDLVAKPGRQILIPPPEA